MKPKEKVLIWGLEHEKDDPIPRAVKFIIEVEHPLFSVQKCQLFEGTNSLHPSRDLIQAFKHNERTLPQGAIIAPAFGMANDYEIVIDGTGEELPHKPDYVMRKEDRNINVYSVDHHVVSISDIVAILTIHKCCEDYIRVTTQKEKDVIKKPLDEILSSLSTPVTNLHSLLQTAKEEGRRYEEVVLDLCTDEFLMTCDQSLKVLALLLASIQKLVEEEEDGDASLNADVPYHQ
jgi:hypothetical protein